MSALFFLSQTVGVGHAELALQSSHYRDPPVLETGQAGLGRPEQLAELKVTYPPEVTYLQNALLFLGYRDPGSGGHRDLPCTGWGRPRKYSCVVTLIEYV